MTDLQTMKDERWWAIRAIISEVVMQNTSGDDATDQIAAIVPSAITALIERVERAEAAMLQVIDERDVAAGALSQAYYLVTGRSPAWSNLFGHAEALTDIEDACDMLRLAVRTKLGLGQ